MIERPSVTFNKPYLAIYRGFFWTVNPHLSAVLLSYRISTGTPRSKTQILVLDFEVSSFRQAGIKRQFASHLPV
jgi:hypothetical protein